MPKGQICILFKRVPLGTNFIQGNYSWVDEREGEIYIREGYGVLFDPKSRQEQKPKPEPKIDIPEDFPGRTHFIEAGILSLKDIESMKDFKGVPGVGRSIEQKITAYFKNKS